jgi:hypothetical protein
MAVTVPAHRMTDNPTRNAPHDGSNRASDGGAGDRSDAYSNGRPTLSCYRLRQGNRGCQ